MNFGPVSPSVGQTAYAAPGSMAAHDQLRITVTLWRLAEAAWEAMPGDPDRAGVADAAWLSVVASAIYCGMPASEKPILRWVLNRITAYHRSMG